jgi:antitoxin ParD1/3/4
MSVSLTPELEQVVNEKVSSGLYPTANDVVREALRLLTERDQRTESLRRDIRGGFDAVARGECTDYDTSTIHKLADRVKSRGRKRVASERPKSSPR